MSGRTIFVPCDAAALSVGADAVAAAITGEAARRQVDIRVVRNGTRGLLWLEPLVEVETAQGRVAYGPVAAEDVPGLFEGGFLDGADHALGHGPTEEIPYFARQVRLTFARCGVIDPLSIDDFKAHGGFAGLAKALAMEPAEIIAQVTESGLRGRGGAGFPTGIKWQTVAGAEGEQKYVCCNADEGDSGTFTDRMIMEGDPMIVIEGMIIAGIATGATQGLIYLRSEYPHAIATMKRAIDLAADAGYLGEDVAGSGRAFSLEVRVGAGSYICGEETAMLESLEGRRGVIRAKPPLPALEGLFAKPTVVNNVLSLAAVPFILDQGGKAYAAHGMPFTGHPALPTGRQHRARRPHRIALRDHPWRLDRGVRRRHHFRPPGAGGPGGRASRRLSAPRVVRPKARLRGFRRGPAPGGGGQGRALIPAPSPIPSGARSSPSRHEAYGRWKLPTP